MNKLYNDEVEITLSPAHRYKVIDRGEIVKPEGVTTVLGRVTAKTGLISWAANMAAESFREAVSSAVADGVDIDTDFLEECLKTAKNAHNVKRDKGADIGSIVHDAIEAYVRDVMANGRGGDVADIDNELASAAFEAFLEWDTTHLPEYTHCEQLVYSRRHRYAGKFDIGFKLNGKHYLADWKSSDPQRVWNQKLKRYAGYQARAEHFLQCAGYDVAYSESEPSPFNAYMVVYVTKKGKLYMFEETDTELLQLGWNHAVNLSRLFKKLG